MVEKSAHMCENGSGSDRTRCANTPLPGPDRCSTSTRPKELTANAALYLPCSDVPRLGGPAVIKRGPDPQGHFQILPHATSRDRRLSFRARGLLALMLSYPVDWEFNRDWLARQSDQEGVSAVRTALKELEAAGYLMRRRVRVNGRFTWEQTIYRHSQKPAGGSTGGLPADEIPPDGDRPSKEDGHEDSYEDETDAAPRSQAHADATNEQDDELSWRAQDLDLFRSLVGNKLKSDGSGNWREGVWTAEVFYRAFRKERKKKWPGRWLQQINENDPDLEYWLLNEGLELV